MKAMRSALSLLGRLPRFFGMEPLCQETSSLRHSLEKMVRAVRFELTFEISRLFVKYVSQPHVYWMNLTSTRFRIMKDLRTNTQVNC